MAALYVACGALAAGCGDLDVVTNTYSTMAEARAAGAVERGWVPGFIPPGAHDLREAHDPGRGRRRWGLFSFPPEDAAPLRDRLGRESGFEGLRVDAPPRIEWWPVALRGTLDGERLAFTGLRAYRLDADGLAVAVNWNQRRAYYWTLVTLVADHPGRDSPDDDRRDRAPRHGD